MRIKGLFFLLLLVSQGVRLTAHCSVLTAHSDDEVVDCIAAVVNGRVITLGDLRFVQAFGLYADELKDGAGDSLARILEKLIDQRVVLDMIREKVSLSREEIDQAVADLTRSLGQEKVQRRLDQFGARPENLRSYVEEKALCRKAIFQRFSQSAAVSLDEIELYYQHDYVPAQRRLGLEPEPMMQILNKIEGLVKEQKTSRQVDSWIMNLRAQSDIELKTNCLGKK